MIDLALDSNNSIYLDNRGNFAVVNGIDQVTQHVKQRLLAFVNEWFLDKSAGFDWFGTVFQEPYNAIIAESEIKKRILETPFVKELTSFEVNLDKQQRVIKYMAIGIVTDSGEIGTITL